MPDQDEDLQQNKKTVEKDDAARSGPQGVFIWVITLAIVVGGTVGGFALAQLIAQAEPRNASAAKTPEKDFFAADAQKTLPWQHDLEPVIANLDEPGVTRFLRVGVTLVMSPEMDQTKGQEFLNDRTPLLTDYISGYIAGLTLERVRGQNNRNRIKREIQAGFNDLLFPDAKPYVHNVLFREFAVQ